MAASSRESEINELKRLGHISEAELAAFGEDRAAFEAALLDPKVREFINTFFPRVHKEYKLSKLPPATPFFSEHRSGVCFTVQSEEFNVIFTGEIPVVFGGKIVGKISGDFMGNPLQRVPVNEEWVCILEGFPDYGGVFITPTRNIKQIVDSYGGIEGLKELAEITHENQAILNLMKIKKLSLAELHTWGKKESWRVVALAEKILKAIDDFKPGLAYQIMPRVSQLQSLDPIVAKNVVEAYMFPSGYILPLSYGAMGLEYFPSERIIVLETAEPGSTKIRVLSTQEDMGLAKQLIKVLSSEAKQELTAQAILDLAELCGSRIFGMFQSDVAQKISQFLKKFGVAGMQQWHDDEIVAVAKLYVKDLKVRAMIDDDNFDIAVIDRGTRGHIVNVVKKLARTYAPVERALQFDDEDLVGVETPDGISETPSGPPEISTATLLVAAPPVVRKGVLVYLGSFFGNAVREKKPVETEMREVVKPSTVPTADSPNSPTQ